MGKAELDPLLKVAGAIADGKPVDWERESETQPDLRAKLRRLMDIQRIGNAHRSPPDDGPETTLPLDTDPQDLPTMELPENPEPLFRWGPLLVLEKIGQGGFGEVYRAHDTNLQKDVALKLIREDRNRDPRWSRRFINEARKLARVRHPNVVVVHGADKHDNRVGLWTDLLEGETLEEILSQKGPFGPEEAALIGIEICAALSAVHAAGLVHRDVKTSNVMRTNQGNYVLMDFSSVTELYPPDDPTGGLPLSGTPLYMAPELFRGEEGGIFSDIYSLGVVLYRLTTGRFPVSGETLSDLARKHRRKESTSLGDIRPDLPKAFTRSVERALSHDPDRRFSSAGEMRRDLSASIGIPGPLEPVPPFWRRRTVIWTLSASTALALGLLAVPFIDPPWNSLAVEAQLFRVRPGTEERLGNGSKVYPGDNLFLEIQGSREMHLYVLNEDERGEAWVLFPLPDLELQNPLAPGSRHRLPGKMNGSSINWEVSSVGGRETFLVIAARDPLKNLEEDIAAIPLAGSTSHLKIGQKTLQNLRGIGGLGSIPGPGEGDLSTDSRRPRLPEIFNDLSAGPTNRNGLWFWEIRLENPGH